MLKPNPSRKENLDAPLELVEALKELKKERLVIPPHVEQPLLRQARAHLERAPRRQLRLWFWRNWLAAAAAILLAGWLAWLLPHAFKSRAYAAAPGDINRDGKVDILDALILAKRVQAGSSAGRESDMNGDRVLNRQDAEAIARIAVKLQKGNGS